MRLIRFLTVSALLLTGCFSATNEPDCLLDHTCECKSAAQCSAGQLCVNGACFTPVDAGQPGGLGWPCTTDGECTVGPCLPKGPGNGNVCTVACNTLDAGTSCPRGWQCKSTGGTAALCVPPIQSLCLSCRADQDCNAAGDKCISLDGGNFCAQDCTFTGCPGGYDCRSVMLDAGVARQCVSQLNTCVCSAASVGLKRSCQNSGSIGTCFGFETCQNNFVFGGCDARVASREICDGIDNDCNGLTDQADPMLDTTGITPTCTKGSACTGLSYCGPELDGGARFKCSAPDPTPETCNGVDDDCNGSVDDGLRDADGGYSTPRACGECSNDCFVTIANLALDAGPGAASCVAVGAAFSCVPQQCKKGFYPAPVGAPTHCEPALTSQCRPCAIDGDCVVPGDSCVTTGTDPGTFCAQSCEASSPYAACTGTVGTRDCCPVNNQCQLVGGSKKCVPTSGSCLCSPGGNGFTRSCFKTLGAATCVGQQVCLTDGGFSSCDTSTVSVELCDGTDNDCNGVVDDGLINTQGTGTWDTDAHCGSCSTDCRARFSPTIQHANGGCLPDAGSPECHIASCTSQTVAGAGLCQLDAQCTGGKTCSPIFHQCVKSCTALADCTTGEACSNGFCGRSCNGNADCVTTLGQGAVCTQNVCGFAYTFANPDKEESNGCECAAATGVSDVPDTFSTYPTVGLPYVDRNCDHLDGTESSSLFVWALSTTSSGTRAHPFRTIAEAMNAFSVGTHTAILVAQGTYVEQVVIRNGASLYGGYSTDFTRRDVTSFPTLIEAPEPDATVSNSKRGSVNAEGITSATVIAGFTVRGYDVTSRPTAGQSARNSYAVYSKNSPGLEIRNNHLVGGRGGDAIAALPGTAGASGGAGANGLNARECMTPLCVNERQSGGAAGTNTSCAMAAIGNPGGGVNPDDDPQQYTSNANGNGHGGSNGVYQHSDPSQSMLCKYDCTVPSDGLNGQPADNGTSGTNSTGGTGCNGGMGALSGDDWVAGRGSTGSANGTPGRGAGGGGGGGCVSNQNPATCTIGNRVGDLGATGGGGGAGGCAGSSGGGGGGGGGSFALFIIGALPTVQGNLLDMGFGGNGGSGGAGGYGGLGGPGGRGGVNTTAAWCAGLGGPGGRGGTGGAGGGGGGGCGGMVAAIAGSSVTAGNFTTTNTIAPQPVNAAGAGGAAGASPAGAMFNGSPGGTGAVSNVVSL